MAEEQKVTFEKKESFQKKETSGGAGSDVTDFGRQESFPPPWARLDDRAGFGSDWGDMHRRFNDLSSNWGDVYRHRQIRENPRDFERLVDDLWRRMRLEPGAAPPADFFRSYGGRPAVASVAPTQESAPIIPPPPRDFGIDRQVSEVKNEKDAWTVKLDCSQYTPEEIEVKCRDNNVFVIGKHEEREDAADSSYVSRQFSRRYILPEGVDPSRVTSSLSRDGMLLVEASKLAIDGPAERKIPIEVKPVGANST